MSYQSFVAVRVGTASFGGILAGMNWFRKLVAMRARTWSLTECVGVFAAGALLLLLGIVFGIRSWLQHDLVQEWICVTQILLSLFVGWLSVSVAWKIRGSEKPTT